MVSKRKKQRIARERIKILFSKAEEKYHEDSDLSDRYVELARSIGMKHNVSIPTNLRRRFCRSCGSYLVPGDNCRVRLNSEHRRKVLTCLECGERKRVPYLDK